MAMTKQVLIEKIKSEYDHTTLIKWVTSLQNSIVKPSQLSKDEFLNKVKSGTFSKVEVESWVEELSDTPLTKVAPGKTRVQEPISDNTLQIRAIKLKPISFKKGDVFMHPIFRHPYVLMEKKRGFWICGLLTSESNCSEILERVKSRFVEESYYTKVMFTVTEPIGNFMFPMENSKQIKSILITLKEIFQ
jgi:hypothetical protein